MAELFICRLDNSNCIIAVVREHFTLKFFEVYFCFAVIVISCVEFIHRTCCFCFLYFVLKSLVAFFEIRLYFRFKWCGFFAWSFLNSRHIIINFIEIKDCCMLLFFLLVNMLAIFKTYCFFKLHGFTLIQDDVVVTDLTIKCSWYYLLLFLNHVEKDVVNCTLPMQIVNVNILLLSNPVSSVFRLNHHSWSPRVLSK